MSLYTDLGVEPSADTDTIRSAYRRLAMQFHPDRQQNKPKTVQEACETRFKACATAYEVLSDPARRLLYDEFGERSLRINFDADEARRNGVCYDFDPCEPDFRPPRRGASTTRTIEVSFLAALRGDAVDVAHRGRLLSVTLPAGAETGVKLRLTGLGEPGEPGAENGDLYLSISVLSHPQLRRDGQNLRFDLHLTWLEALQGGPLPITTPWGERWPLRFAPGEAVEGFEFELEGQGVRDANGEGLLVLRVRLVPPTTISRALVEALREVQKTEAPRAALEAGFVAPASAGDRKTHGREDWRW